MPKRLAELLSSVLHTSESWKHQLLRNWSEILGPLADKVCLQKVYNKTLVLSVQDSCWLQEMHLLSPVLLKTINKTLDQPHINQLRFTLAGKPKKKTASKKNIPQSIPHKNVRLTPREKKTLAAIGDTELRHALKGFLVRCYQEKK